MGHRRHGNKAQVKVAVSTFIPKVMTPFQWDGQDSTVEIEAKWRRCARRCAAWPDHVVARPSEFDPGGRPRPRRPATRGSHPAGMAEGRTADAWDEHFDSEIWLAAFAAEGLDPVWYAQRDIPVEEPLPWST